MRHAILADRAIDARFCRNEGVAYPYIYEPASILTHGPLGLLAIAAVFSTVPVGNQIAESVLSAVVKPEIGTQYISTCPGLAFLALLDPSGD